MGEKYEREEREIEQNAYDIAYSWFFVCLFVFATNWHGFNFPVIPIHNDMIFEFKGSIFALFSSFLLWKVLQWHSGFKQFTIHICFEDYTNSNIC